MLASARAIARSSPHAPKLRALSTAITADELKAGAEMASKHTAFMQSTTAPRSLTGAGMGSGVELHRPDNMTEIAALTGQPTEHRNRTVIVAPREHKTTQVGFLKCFFERLESCCFLVAACTRCAWNAGQPSFA